MTPELEPSTHAKLSASSASRWMACPGSVKLSEGAPNTTSFYAAEGTLAHWVASECIENARQPDDYLGFIILTDGYEIECTEDMVDAVQVYVDLVNQCYEEGATISVEYDLTPALKKVHPDFGGTADALAHYPEQSLLKVFDYKHGAGQAVSVVENKQLKYYALGALLTYHTPVTRVEVNIVQPRCGIGEPVKTWEFDALDLLEFRADLLEAVEVVYSDTPPLNPGPEQCKWCLAATKCPALEKKQLMVMSEQFDVVGIDFVTPEKLAEALDILPLVEARISQIRELAYNQGLQGNPPPGYKIVEKQARRKWKSETEAETYAEMMLGEKAFTDPKLKSPAQIEKLLKKEDRKDIEDYVVKQSSGYTLVHTSDKRPPALLAAPEDFDNVEEAK